MVICIMLYDKKEHFKQTRLENFPESSKKMTIYLLTLTLPTKVMKNSIPYLIKLDLKRLKDLDAKRCDEIGLLLFYLCFGSCFHSRVK